MDIVGPISRATRRGDKYILSIVDFATKFPEAVAFKDIEVKIVAEALMTVFSRLGLPIKIDLGTSFMSQVMKDEVMWHPTSDYHSIPSTGKWPE